MPSTARGEAVRAVEEAWSERRGKAEEIQKKEGSGKMSYNSYGNMRRVSYEGATFVPVCEHCGRFVRADKDIMVNGLDDVSDAPNATCAKCGRVKMPFEGWL